MTDTRKRTGSPVTSPSSGPEYGLTPAWPTRSEAEYLRRQHKEVNLIVWTAFLARAKEVGAHAALEEVTRR